MTDALLEARARVLRDLAARGLDIAATVSVVDSRHTGMLCHRCTSHATVQLYCASAPPSIMLRLLRRASLRMRLQDRARQL